LDLRLIINIKNSNLIRSIEREYIRNFIYKSLQNTKWSFYHDKPKYKHFCFSNLFPFNKDGKIDADFNLIISSPYDDLIWTIQKLLVEERILKLGDNNFEILKTRLCKTPLNISTIITATPIIERISEKKFKKYGIQSQKDYAYWTEGEILNAFIDSVSNNLLLRYKNFSTESEVLGFKAKYNSYPDDLRIFSTLKYKKTVYAWDKHNVGTMWEFGISNKYTNSDIVHYLYETGLGERNASSGSGFVNIKLS